MSERAAGAGLTFVEGAGR